MTVDALNDNKEEENKTVPPEKYIPIDQYDQGKYPEPEAIYTAPFQSKIGNSTVDLSLEDNQNQMMKEYKKWTGMKRGTTKDANMNQWYKKYHGMEFNQFREEKSRITKEDPFFNPHKRLKGTIDTLRIPGLAWTDFFSDSLRHIPGYKNIDDRWDEASKLDNPLHQQLRGILSVVLPSIQGASMVKGSLSKLPAKMPNVQKALIGTGAYTGQEMAVVTLSQVGEEHNILGQLAKSYPGVLGPKGSHPLPSAITTYDSDSVAVRQAKNRYEVAGLSVFGSILGAALTINNKLKVMDWLDPVDDKAVKYKQKELSLNADPDKLIRVQKLNEILSGGNFSRNVEVQLMDELMTLQNELGIVDKVDNVVARDAKSIQIEQNAAAKMKIDNPTQLELDLNVNVDPDITPGILDEAASARQTIPPGNVARNMADTTAIKQGLVEGDPAPIMTDAMRAKGLMVGNTSRAAVMGVAEEGRDIGRFNALVDGFRFSNKQMNAAAWDIYTTIVDPGVSVDDVKNLFLENRDIKNLLLGKFKVEVINEEQARAAAFAMRDLTDRFLGRPVTEASARAMDTLGREAATMAEAMTSMKPFVDDNRAMDLIIDKMQFLMDEYALNKYISGWQLRNKNWFDQVPPKDIDTVIDTLTKEFTTAENAIHAKNIKFTKTLKELKKTKPEAMRPLVDAFAHTNGDVDSLAKLYDWSAKQITPLGAIKSPDPKQMNLFATGLWGTRYNNVLSGKSPFRAGQGNVSQLMLKPITTFMGHGLLGDVDGLKELFYYNGAVFDTNRRALHDAYQMMKKAHKDPEMMIKAYRKDFVFKEDKTWDIMNDMRKVYEKDGNWGRIMQLDSAQLLTDLSKHPALRLGMTGMVFPDVFTTTHLAHYLSRVKAYDDVFSEFGYADWTKIHKAQEIHYKNFFDENGLLKDDVLRSIAGEVQLNLDDGLANWLNQATTAYPITKDLMMFPRTSSNYIKNSLSWTPISVIPGINKYSKTIWAKTDDEIAAALMEHGIDMARTPNAKAIFRNLKAEYVGRLAFSSMLTTSLWQYAMGGNIRGNGHYNASRRSKERTQYGYEPKTINLGGKWISYKGIPGIEQILSIIGDMSYYAKDMEESTLANWQSKVTWCLAASFLNETPLQGFEPLIAATNGDLTGWSRLVANSVRSYIPGSSALGITSEAITSSLKNLDGSWQQYVMNRLPGFSSMLPEQYDLWTGKGVNDIENPWARIVNAFSPTPMSSTKEDWRLWLLHDVNYKGYSMIKRDTTGSYEYTTDEASKIARYIGEQEPYKDLLPLMRSKRYQRELAETKAYRKSGAELDNDKIQINTDDLPVHAEIDKILSRAHKIAELRLFKENPEIKDRIRNQLLTDKAMKSGDVNKAAAIEKKDLEMQNLINLPK